MTSFSCSFLVAHARWRDVKLSYMHKLTGSHPQVLDESQDEKMHMPIWWLQSLSQKNKSFSYQRWPKCNFKQLGSRRREKVHTGCNTVKAFWSCSCNIEVSSVSKRPASNWLDRMIATSAEAFMRLHQLTISGLVTLTIILVHTRIGSFKKTCLLIECIT